MQQVAKEEYTPYQEQGHHARQGSSYSAIAQVPIMVENSAQNLKFEAEVLADAVTEE